MQSDYRTVEKAATGGLVLPIALGVFLGSLAASLVIWFAVQAWARYQLHQVQQAVQAQAEQSRHELRRAALEADARAARDAALNARSREQQEALQREANEAAARQQSQREAREDAWKRFFRPTAGCASQHQTTECANEFIRAKRAFDAQYLLPGQ